MHVFISSELDMCKDLLYDLPSAQMKRLQKIRNRAALLVMGAGVREHMTPVLKTCILPLASNSPAI